MSPIKHITHLEDLLFQKSSREGLYQVIEIFKNLSQENLKIKYDGAPAIVTGRLSLDNKNFVSTKSFFNKTPKFWTSSEEIESSDLNENLKQKLISVLESLPTFEPGTIIQGDLLWHDFNFRNIENKIFCHPNTLLYEKPEDATQSVGMCWHTEYDSNLNPYQIKSKIPHTDKIYSFDTNLSKDIDFHDFYRGVLMGYQSLDMNLSSNICKHLKVYVNNRVKSGLYNGFIASDFIEFCNDKYNIDHSISYDIHNLDILFELFCLISEIKLDIINRINNTITDNIFVISKVMGLVNTNHEGYVYNNKGTVIKFVNREEFSFHNFSDQFEKGMNPNRR